MLETDWRRWGAVLLVLTGVACGESVRTRNESTRPDAGAPSTGGTAGRGGASGATSGGTTPAGGQAGTGSGGSAGTSRQCSTLPALGPMAQCEAGELGCFVHGDQRVLAPRDATDCSGWNDECGCEATSGGDGGAGGDTGEGCEAGLSCARVHVPTVFASYPDHYENRCVRRCTSDAECAEGTCFGGVCGEPPECLTGADCTAEPCGHCTEFRLYGHLAVGYYGRPSCAYDGPCAPDACSECNPVSEDRGQGSYDAHFCTYDVP